MSGKMNKVNLIIQSVRNQLVVQSITVYLELNEVNPTSTLEQSEDQSESR